MQSNTENIPLGFLGKSLITLRIPPQICNSLSLELIVCLLPVHTQSLPPDYQTTPLFFLLLTYVK